MSRGGHVYIVASRRRGTLYVGVTSNLAARAWQHRNSTTPGFTSRYGVKRLVYAEWYDDIRDAIDREKRLKWWRRAWKIELIERMNPDWIDLGDFVDGPGGWDGEPWLPERGRASRDGV